MVLTNGYDRRIDLQVLPPHNKTFKTYEELYEQFLEYYDIVIDCLVTTNNIQHDVWRKHNMSLVNSFLKPDCLAKGQHIGNMGYRYNATYNIEDTGTINMVNSLYNIKKLVFEDKKYTLEELTDALINNFGFKNADEIGSFSLEAQEKRDDDDGRYDQIHADCLRSFKYGNVQQHLHLLTGVFPVLLLLTLLCLHILVLTAMVPMHYLNPLLAGITADLKTHR